MNAAQAKVELVMRTTTSLLARRLAPREAVTILATQAPQARAVAAALVRADPERAATYAALIAALAAELEAGVDDAEGAADRRAVIDDLRRLVDALTG